MSRRVRILYVISSLEQGGAERQLAELIRGLDLTKYEPRLALCDTTDQLGYDLPTGERFSLDSASGSTPRTLVKLVKVLREVRPDVLHSFMGLVNIYSRIAVKLTGIGRAVGAVRNGRPPFRDLVYEGLTQSLTDALIVNSVGIREKLVRVSRIPPARIDVIENGVDTDRFRPLSPDVRARLRREWGMDGPALVLVGRVSSEKNHLGVVHALGALRRRGVLPPGVRVFFAGRTVSERFTRRIDGVARTHGVGDHVRFLGPVTSIETLLGAADGVILPSHYEGIPNAVIEGFACGTPAVVSPAANLDTIVRDGEEGIVCESSSAPDVARGIERFLALTEDERDAMGGRGRASAETRFSLRRMVGRTCDVYERVLATGP